MLRKEITVTVGSIYPGTILDNQKMQKRNKKSPLKHFLILWYEYFHFCSIPFHIKNHE